MATENCVVCNAVIPEGQQVCPQCMKKYGVETAEAAQMAEELRDIAKVLKITEGTDLNIKESMEAILRIADRLERKNNGKR